MEKQRILIVDDDVDLCDSLVVLLENAGYDMSSAANKAEGLAKIRSEHPDMIILDVVLDTWQDGFEMSRELKADPVFKTMPILMLTSIETKTGIEFQSTAGDPTWLPVDGFLSKPASPDGLLTEVRRLLQGLDTPRPIKDVESRRRSVTGSESCPSGRS